MTINNTLKIGVNGRFLTKQFTGIGRYTLELFLSLAKLHPNVEIIMVVPEDVTSEIRDRLKERANLKLVILPEITWLRRMPGLAKSYWERFQLSAFLKQIKVPIIHSPYPSLTANKGETKLVITVHDTIPWTVKEYVRHNFLGNLYNRAVLKRIEKADKIVTVSNFSQNEIAELIHISPQDIAVIYNACDLDRANDYSNEEQKEILNKYGVDLTKPYLFYLGGYDKRKNTERLVRIFEKFIAPHGDLQLVLGGAEILNNKLFEDLEEIRKGKKQNIVFTGFIKESELELLYRKAKVFVNLSTSEGFNLNLLEALSQKIPCIVSDLEVHREVAQESAYFIDLKKSDQEIGQEIADLLGQEKSYNQLREKAMNFKSPFSWEMSARKLYKLYIDILNQ